MRLTLVEETVICRFQLSNTPLVGADESLRVSQTSSVQQP